MYSLRDSIIKPEELVEKLKKLGQDAVAITDHGTSLGGVSIYKLLKKNGIKYIHGCEFYSCDSVKIKDKDNKYYHLVVLCKNEQGRQNLNKLISISGHPDNKYVKPRIDFALLSQYGEGLIVLSACLAGEVSKLLMGGDYESAKQVSLKYKERFKGDYYLEIQSHSDETQIKTNKQIIKICKETGIECVVTCDAHYVNKADKKYQNKYAFNGAYKEDGEAYIDCFIQSENEVRERIDYLEPAIIDSAIKNTEIISQKCNVEIPLSAPIMPTIETPDTFRNNKDWLMSLCIRGFEEKLNIDYLNCKIKDENRKLKLAVYADDEDGDGEFVEWREYQLTQEQVNAYIDRYEYELNSLERMGFIDYILLVYSYANVGKRRGIARGSGGGSLINYITNITNIDPIEHGLYFERFIDVGALDLLESGEITPNELKIPDIDLDFSGESCNDVLHWLYNKYGEERVASIGKFGTNQTKGSIRDFCKVLDIDIETADRIAKAFSSYELDDIDAMISGVVKPIASANDAIYFVNNYPELFDYVRKLNGLPKSFGLHACGKVISTKELDYYLPSCYDADGIRYLQGDMHDVEDVGLVKIDVLGLRTLDQEYDTLEMTEESEEFINPKQDFHDKKVLDIFKNGNTIGIFQMASSGMKQTLKKMDVRGIDDISVANALFRPGAMAYIDSFCKRRSGTESFEYLHPDLEPILKSTYGIIVFQEQLIEIGRMAGIRNPDLLRKATGKKDPKLLEQVKPELEGKLKERGWNESQFNQLWSDMIEFSRYSFNRSHAAAYAIIAYMTAKQKAYYPAEFYAGLCNSYLNKSSFVKDNVYEIFEDMNQNKITFAKFDYMQDHRRCSVRNGKILYAISLIRECNQHLADTVNTLKQMECNYFSDVILYLLENKVQKGQIKILVLLGFFDRFGNPKELLRILSFMESFKFGDMKQIDKTKIADDNIENIISNYSTYSNKKDYGSGKYIFTNGSIELLQEKFKPLRKQELVYEKKKEIPPDEFAIEILEVKNLIKGEYAFIFRRFFNDCEKQIKTICIHDFSFKEKIASHMEYLGFVNLTTNKEEDRRKLLLRNVVPLKSKDSGEIWGYALFTQSIGSGKMARLTLKSELYDIEPVKKMDTIFAKSVDKNKSGWWYLYDYEVII